MAESLEVSEAIDIVDAEVVLEIDMESWFCSRRNVWIESSSSPKVLCCRAAEANGAGCSGTDWLETSLAFFVVMSKM